MRKFVNLGTHISKRGEFRTVGISAGGRPIMNSIMKIYLGNLLKADKIADNSIQTYLVK
jgi:hypothetical protein